MDPVIMAHSSMERWKARGSTIGQATSIGMKANTRITFEMDRGLTTSTSSYIKRVFGEEDP
jgi:hypothetical protein